MGNLATKPPTEADIRGRTYTNSLHPRINNPVLLSEVVGPHKSVPTSHKELLFNQNQPDYIKHVPRIWSQSVGLIAGSADQRGLFSRGAAAAASGATRYRGAPACADRPGAGASAGAGATGRFGCLTQLDRGNVACFRGAQICSLGGAEGHFQMCRRGVLQPLTRWLHHGPWIPNPLLARERRAIQMHLDPFWAV